jgi:hypothetical protein
MQHCKNNFVSLSLLLSLILLLSAALPLSLVPESGHPDSSGVKTADIAWKGYVSNQEKRFINVVTTGYEWDTQWKHAFDKAAPEIDFEKHAVACNGS